MRTSAVKNARSNRGSTLLRTMLIYVSPFQLVTLQLYGAVACARRIAGAKPGFYTFDERMFDGG